MNGSAMVRMIAVTIPMRLAVNATPQLTSRAAQQISVLRGLECAILNATVTTGVMNQTQHVLSAC